MCAGAVLIAVFGAIGEPAHNLDQLLELLGRRQFILWMICQLVLVIAIIAGAKALKIMNPRTSNSPRMRLFRGMAYGCISGILSAHSLLVAKSAVELLVRTIADRHNEFNRWQSWMILLGLVALALFQLYYLHRGLKLCSTSILYPFVFCVYNIIAILDGLIYFHQASLLSVSSALLVSLPPSLSYTELEAHEPSQIALGTFILLSGVVCLSWRLNTDPTTHPPVIQNPLTPGMGFVNDSETSDVENATEDPEPDVEEASLDGNNPYLFSPNHKRKPSSTTDPRTPTTRNNDLLAVTRLRRRGITESEEIWEELEDDTVDELSPFGHRRHSAMSTPAKNTPRIGTDDNPSEASPLLERSSTGRSYRDKRRRRSAPAVEGRKKGAECQEATGGWWKLSWWRGRKTKGKDAGDGRVDENGDVRTE